MNIFQSALSRISNDYNRIKDTGEIMPRFSYKQYQNDPKGQTEYAVNNLLPLVMGMSGGVTGLRKITPPSLARQTVQQGKELVPNEAMKRVFELSNQMKQTGNVSIDATDEVLKMAQQYLKLPKDVFSRMKTGDLLDDLTSLATQNQSYAYHTLPLKNARIPQTSTSLPDYVQQGERAIQQGNPVSLSNVINLIPKDSPYRETFVNAMKILTKGK